MSDIYDQIDGATNEELWELLGSVEGEVRGDVLSQLALSYDPEQDGLPKIAMAEMAIEEYKKAGIDESDSDYAFCWATIAENKALIGDFNGALEYAIKAQPLITAQLLRCYDDFKWNMIKWYVKAGRYDEAHIQLASAILETRFMEEWDE